MSDKRPHRLCVARVPVDAKGRPDLKIPADCSYWNEWPGRLWHVYGRGHTLTVLKLGEVANGDWGVVCVGDNQALKWLRNQGCIVELFKDAWANAQYRQWLENHGVDTDDEGDPIAPISYCGDSPIGLAMDWPDPPPEH